MNNSDGLVGKYAYKKRGFFSGIIGIIELSNNEISKYSLVYKDGSRNAFTSEDEITLVDLNKLQAARLV